MPNVIVDKDKLDVLANAISAKSGEPLTLTLDEMVDAVDGIETGGGGITPTGNIDITSAGVTDVTNYATATVPTASFWVGANIWYETENNARKWKYQPTAELDPSEGDVAGWVAPGHYRGDTTTYNAIAKNTSVTPTESAQTIGGANTMMEGAVTVNAIPSNYVGSGVTQRSSSDLSASGATVTAPAGYYSTNATKTISNGSATPAASITATSATLTTSTNTITLTKSVSNTPQVTAGYIASGTAGTSSVSLSASMTMQGAQTIYPSSSDQTISSGRYLTGTQTIKGVTTTNLTADNIKSGVVVQVGDSADADRVLSVTGTYTGGGGSSDVVMGTLTVASNVNTSTSTQITTTSAIGFTPTKFLFYRSDRSATSNHVNQASFVTLGSSYYVRTMTRYSNNALSTSGNANSWTTQTAGYLYFNSNTVYFRSSSSYILPAGTWYWVAIK